MNPATPWARFKDIMSQSEVQPIGKTTFANYGRWKNDTVEALLTEASQATDDATKKAAYDKLDALYRKEIPACPIMYRPDEFYEYNATQLLQLARREEQLRPADVPRRRQHWMYKIKKITG